MEFRGGEEKKKLELRLIRHREPILLIQDQNPLSLKNEIKDSGRLDLMKGNNASTTENTYENLLQG